MHKDIFIKQCIQRGICYKKIANEYTKNFCEDHDYTEEDFEKVFAFENNTMCSKESRGLRMYDGALCTKHFAKYGNECY